MPITPPPGTGSGGVSSVNGDTGPVVVLDAADVGAATAAEGVLATTALQAPTLAGVNSVTSATGQDLTLAALDGNNHVLITPHGSGLAIVGGDHPVLAFANQTWAIGSKQLIVGSGGDKLVIGTQGGMELRSSFATEIDFYTTDILRMSVGTGGLTIGGGAPIKAILSAVASLSFSASLGSSSGDASMTVTGAAVNDRVVLGINWTGASFPTLSFFAWVSAADTVIVRCSSSDVLAPGFSVGPFSISATVIQS